MKILAVRQPWAWLLVNGFKDIENRSWSTRHRGRLIIHASAAKARMSDMESAIQLLNKTTRRRREIAPELPDRETFTYGALIGSIDVIDIVTKHKSCWFEGKYGWVVANPIAYTSPISAVGRLLLYDPTPQQRRLLLKRERLVGYNFGLSGRERPGEQYLNMSI